MRLKEPLYGLRVAKLHWVIHLSLAVAMIYMESQFTQEGGDYVLDKKFEGEVNYQGTKDA